MCIEDAESGKKGQGAVNDVTLHSKIIKRIVEIVIKQLKRDLKI